MLKNLMKLNSKELHLLNKVIGSLPVTDYTEFQMTRIIYKEMKPLLVDYYKKGTAIMEKYETEIMVDKDGKNVLDEDGKVKCKIPTADQEKVDNEIYDLTFELDTDSSQISIAYYIYQKLVRFLDKYSSKEIPKLQDESSGLMVFGDLLDKFETVLSQSEKDSIIAQFIK